MTTQDRLELAARSLDEIQAVLEWSTTAPEEVQDRARQTLIEAQYVFGRLLVRLMEGTI